MEGGQSVQWQRGGVESREPGDYPLKSPTEGQLIKLSTSPPIASRSTHSQFQSANRSALGLMNCLSIHSPTLC